VAADLSHDLKRHLPLTQLLRWSGQVPADERLVMSHGDFQPGNLLVSASGFTVIDFATAGVRPAGADLAWFVTFVLSQRERVVLGNAAGTRRFVMKFCREFLSGYDFDFSRASQIVRPYLGLVVVGRLADLQKRIDHWPPPARPLLRNRLVGWADSELRWFLREFE
jgi:aminoglycoside phosphotransferase (APT) family kinase protein